MESLLARAVVPWDSMYAGLAEAGTGIHSAPVGRLGQGHASLQATSGRRPCGGGFPKLSAPRSARLQLPPPPSTPSDSGGGGCGGGGMAAATAMSLPSASATLPIPRRRRRAGEWEWGAEAIPMGQPALRVLEGEGAPRTPTQRRAGGCGVRWQPRVTTRCCGGRSCAARRRHMRGGRSRWRGERRGGWAAGA